MEGEPPPLYKYAFYNRYQDVELDTAFTILTKNLKFEELFNKSRELHTANCKKKMCKFITFANIKFMSLDFLQLLFCHHMGVDLFISGVFHVTRFIGFQ